MTKSFVTYEVGVGVVEVAVLGVDGVEREDGGGVELGGVVEEVEERLRERAARWRLPGRVRGGCRGGTA